MRMAHGAVNAKAERELLSGINSTKQVEALKSNYCKKKNSARREENFSFSLSCSSCNIKRSRQKGVKTYE